MGESLETPSTEAVAVFDGMADQYDAIREYPWYAWLFARLHTLIFHNVIRPYAPQTVLDVGCGTGFQSFLYAAFGARVVGIDASSRMIRIAREKATWFPADRATLITIPAPFSFIRLYNRWICERLNGIEPGACVSPAFEVADARRLPFPERTFDHVNCCGSTLSLVPDYHQVLAEIVRVLKPGGTLFLEAEGRWNGDLLWALTEALTGRCLYGISWKQVLAMVRPPFSGPVTIDYPFKHTRLKLTLFTRRGLLRDLRQLGLKVLKGWTVHSLTNLIPSPLLHREDVPWGIRWLFQTLAWAEERIPLALPGCSLVFLAQKEA